MAKEQKQDIDLGFTRAEHSEQRKAVLQIWTYKHEGRIISSCTVFWVGDRSRSTAMGIGGGGDFSRRLRVTTARGTQKNIDTQHAEVFTDQAVIALVAEAKAQYTAAVTAS